MVVLEGSAVSYERGTHANHQGGPASRGDPPEGRLAVYSGSPIWWAWAHPRAKVDRCVL